MIVAFKQVGIDWEASNILCVIIEGDLLKIRPKADFKITLDKKYHCNPSQIKCIFSKVEENIIIPMDKECSPIIFDV